MYKIMRGAVAFFVKTPGLSATKTRLAHKIGTQKAREVYGHCLACMRETVRQLQQGIVPLKPYWAVAEKNGLKATCWKNAACLWTGPGPLAERLRFVYHALRARHDYVILACADTPLLEAGCLLGVHKHLCANRREAVFGPALDGGFYLVASSLQYPPSMWRSITYSSRNTGSDLLARLSVYSSLRRLKPLPDIDRCEDLCLYRHLLSGPLSPERRAFATWLEQEKNSCLNFAAMSPIIQTGLK